MFLVHKGTKKLSKYGKSFVILQKYYNFNQKK